jgi:hypothetical protein
MATSKNVDNHVVHEKALASIAKDPARKKKL